MPRLSFEIWVLPAGTTLPAAGETYRNVIVLLPGGAGVADKYYLCMKTSADAYAWRKIWDGDCDIVVNSITGL